MQRHKTKQNTAQQLASSTWGWHGNQQSTAGHSLQGCEVQLERVFDQ